MSTKVYSSFFISLLFSQLNFAQSTASKNWFNQDIETDKVYGTGSDRVFQSIDASRKTKKIIVAVIDGGVDTEQEDLKDVIWTNPAEIAGNGIDDDKNGYIDDVHGWSFIGGKQEDVFHDNIELTRLVRDGIALYNGNDSIAARKNSLGYSIFLSQKKEFDKLLKEAKSAFTELQKSRAALDSLYMLVARDSILLADSSLVVDKSETIKKVYRQIKTHLLAGNSFVEFKKKFAKAYDAANNKVGYHLNLNYSIRNIVGDNYADATEKFYGNNHVKGPKADHGTHVAGIIAAKRNNNIGMNGVCAAAEIMVLRVVPDGDERDKDVANAVRYAADNGARIINMSFGKYYSYNKDAVDDAFLYATNKGVLLVHAAGNNGFNIDTGARFPSIRTCDYELVSPSWIDVGAINFKGEPAKFSNYGKKVVSLFAPGVGIYSTLPEDKYDNLNGTSMACPAVSGVAALIWSYHPELSSKQIKKIVMKSVTKINAEVITPGKSGKKQKFKKLCQTGGVINAYEAFKLADKKYGTSLQLK